MNLDKPECNQCCAGSAPFFMCRDTKCICHLEKHLRAIKTPHRLTHRDPVANEAIGNVMKGTRR